MMRMPGEMFIGLRVQISREDNSLDLVIETQEDISTAVEFLEKEFKKLDKPENNLATLVPQEFGKPLEDLK